MELASSSACHYAILALCHFLFIARRALTAKVSPRVTLSAVVEDTDAILTPIIMLADFVLSALLDTKNSGGVSELRRRGKFSLAAVATKEGPFFTLAVVIELAVTDLTATGILANV